jgi:FlaA1/EpsC-like NDP-sugar epimerase
LEVYIIASCYIFNYVLLLQYDFNFNTVIPLLFRFSLYLVIVSMFLYLFRTHRDSVRYTGIPELIRLFLALFLAHFALIASNFLYFSVTGNYFFSTLPLVYSMLFSLLSLITFRLIIKTVYRRIKRTPVEKGRKKVLMVGTNDENISVVKFFNSDPNAEIEFTGFISSEQHLKNKRISGLNIHVYEDNNLETVKLENIDGLVILEGEAINKKTDHLIDIFVKEKKEILSSSLTRIHQFKSKKSFQLKKIDFEDLLFRNPINIDEKRINDILQGKVVLVTGGGGSIGSELVRQLCAYHPDTIVIVDNAETPLFFIEKEINDEFPQIHVIACLADVTNVVEMSNIFEQYKPFLVCHAAAYKHVTMMEKNPIKAFTVNVLGSKNVADLCIRHQVRRMVMVSTDKAVNPSCIMGLSKRLAELYVQAKCREIESSGNCKTNFIITRFGNVLGSNGSVIQIFRKQLRENKPLTVTHPEMTRYFMTIAEASKLVLQSAIDGISGNIYIFDMGEPVKILDMAYKLLRMNGLEPNVDVDIVFTGKKQGEKLHEELFYENCITEQTTHPKIHRIIESHPDTDTIISGFDQIRSAISAQNMDLIMVLSKNIVPEYVHENEEAEKVRV